MKITPKRLHPREILSDEIVALLMKEMPRVMDAQICQLFENSKIDVERGLRFQAVAVRCKEAREQAKMSLKDVSLALRIPQYRIKEIEERSESNVVPKILHRYLALLGLSRWYRKWAKVNPKLAARLRWDQTRAPKPAHERSAIT